MTLGMALGAVVLAGALLGVARVLLTAHHLQGVVDLAALAASDVSRGLGGEFPCEVARHIVSTAGFTLLSCEVVEGRARLIGDATVAGVTVSRRSHAGVSHSGQR